MKNPLPDDEDAARAVVREIIETATRRSSELAAKLRKQDDLEAAMKAHMLAFDDS